MDGIKPTDRIVLQQKETVAASTYGAGDKVHKKKQRESSKTRTEDTVTLSSKDLAETLLKSGLASEIMEKKEKEKKKKEVSAENLAPKTPKEILADVPEEMAKAAKKIVENQIESLAKLKNVPGTAGINSEAEESIGIMPIDDQNNKPLIELNGN